MAQNAQNGQHDFIEFVCKPVEDLYLASGERRAVRIKKGTEYRCSMLRDQHFSSLFRHYGKHNGVDKETLVFFFTEELMQELEGSDTPRSVHLRKNDVIVIRHRRVPKPNDLVVRLDLNRDNALALIEAYPPARALQSADGRTALHHLAHRGGEAELAVRLLLLGCNPATLDNYGQTAAAIATERRHADLAAVLQVHEYKRQMAVIRAHFVGGSRRGDDAGPPKPAHDIILKRACTSKNVCPEGEVKHHAAVRFLFSALAHGNQARNFKRVVCFLYA
mmetsp:Transcript_23764/g.71289  ORF Transcript_23764/g.71289 Transcript_23764/m.71289 type:complete len:277 (-) Transcript_23764:98-928(-)|eukprot:CAMPEP_0119271956 /NCGR_PEP_ID=MMETSP1329-20130426/8333_1 /TAXON_ID=114041 /ORGANISM="Genus nov. species nov., Strain RCC1024" /LENGTH=276 /DNA_ID=CAMNT_0007272013 /DNA_START=160 /DNA_END=990 /DNA_ORIENTATION=-